jgi:hypothetical protein
LVGGLDDSSDKDMIRGRGRRMEERQEVDGLETDQSRAWCQKKRTHLMSWGKRLSCRSLVQLVEVQGVGTGAVLGRIAE